MLGIKTLSKKQTDKTLCLEFLESKNKTGQVDVYHKTKQFSLEDHHVMFQE